MPPRTKTPEIPKDDLSASLDNLIDAVSTRDNAEKEASKAQVETTSDKNEQDDIDEMMAELIGYTGESKHESSSTSSSSKTRKSSKSSHKSKTTSSTTELDLDGLIADAEAAVILLSFIISLLFYWHITRMYKYFLSFLCVSISQILLSFHAFQYLKKNLRLSSNNPPPSTGIRVYSKRRSSASSHQLREWIIWTN